MADDKTFTQDEVNGFVADARREATSKADEKITTLTGQIETLVKENESSTGIAVQAEERAKEMEKALNETKHSALRYKVGLDKGLPLTVAERLQGDDETALAKDADGLAELLKRPGDGLKPTPQGEGVPEGDENDMNARIRAASGRG